MAGNFVDLRLGHQRDKTLHSILGTCPVPVDRDGLKEVKDVESAVRRVWPEAAVLLDKTGLKSFCAITHISANGVHERQFKIQSADDFEEAMDKAIQLHIDATHQPHVCVQCNETNCPDANRRVAVWFLFDYDQLVKLNRYKPGMLRMLSGSLVEFVLPEQKEKPLSVLESFYKLPSQLLKKEESVPIWKAKTSSGDSVEVYCLAEALAKCSFTGNSRQVLWARSDLHSFECIVQTADSVDGGNDVLTTSSSNSTKGKHEHSGGITDTRKAVARDGGATVERKKRDNAEEKDKTHDSDTRKRPTSHAESPSPKNKKLHQDSSLGSRAASIQTNTFTTLSDDTSYTATQDRPPHTQCQAGSNGTQAARTTSARSTTLFPWASSTLNPSSSARRPSVKRKKRYVEKGSIPSTPHVNSDEKPATATCARCSKIEARKFIILCLKCSTTVCKDCANLKHASKDVSSFYCKTCCNDGLEADDRRNIAMSGGAWFEHPS